MDHRDHAQQQQRQWRRRSWQDENGDPVAPPSAPYEVPIIADTVCFDSTDDRHMLYRQPPATDVVLQGALNTLEFQDSLRAALFDSYGTIANPLPMSQRCEIGGVIVYSETIGDYIFRRVASEPGTESHCSYVSKPAKTFAGEFIIAWFHTYPIRDFEDYYCPEVSDTLLTANTEGMGGGSGVDWAFATSQGKPSYTIDPDRIWRLEPDTDSLSRQSNPQRWSTGTSGVCAPRAAF